MKTYWDYSEKERSLMTEEFVTTLLSAELMVKGVRKVSEFSPKEIQLVELSKTLFYSVGSLVFKTAQQADDFLKLEPMSEEYDYNIGYEIKYPKEYDKRISQVMLYSEEEIARMRSILIKNKEAKDFNEKHKSEFKKANDAVNNVTKGVWDNWFECKAKAENYQKLLDTKAEYTNLTEGDSGLARTFLQKVYSDDEISAAELWFSEAV